ncbi:MAG: Bor family protein [Pseudomonadales bacterium]|nr:Bor family protein [Pseudomonadales bacterium]
MIKKLSLLACLVSLLAACSTVTIQPKAAEKQTQAADFSETRHFFFWGLMGETHVDVKDICADKAITQMQSQATFVNGLLTVVTLGIYAPHSVKVWCETPTSTVESEV